MAKTMTGVVASDSADKTISVTITTRKTHPLYKKQYRVTKKFLAHDEQNSAHIGDSVEITPVRPISKRKHYKLLRIVEKARLKHVEDEVTELAKSEPAAVAATTTINEGSLGSKEVLPKVRKTSTTKPLKSKEAIE